jgi:hypothetical protein
MTVNACMPGANRPQQGWRTQPFCRFLPATPTHRYALTPDLFPACSPHRRAERWDASDISLPAPTCACFMLTASAAVSLRSSASCRPSPPGPRKRPSVGRGPELRRGLARRHIGEKFKEIDLVADRGSRDASQDVEVAAAALAGTLWLPTMNRNLVIDFE